MPDVTAKLKAEVIQAIIEAMNQRLGFDLGIDYVCKRTYPNRLLLPYGATFLMRI